MKDLDDDLIDLGIRRVNQTRAEQGALWLYNGLIPDGGFGVLLGDSGVGKSTIAMDLSAAVATATPFAGYEYGDHNLIEPRAVLYMYGEGGESIDARMATALETRRQSYSLWKPHAFEYQSIEEVPILPWELVCAADGPKSLRSVAAEFSRKDHGLTIAKELGLSVGLIVVDTWSAVSGLTNENDNSVTQDRISSFKEIASTFNSTVLVVAHTKKGTDEMRGATSVVNAADFVLRVDKKKSVSGVRSLVHQKARHGAIQEPKHFRLLPSNVSPLSVGNPLVVDWLDNEIAEQPQIPARKMRVCTADSSSFSWRRRLAEPSIYDDMSSFDVYIDAIQLAGMGCVPDANGASWITLMEARAMFDRMYQRNAEANRKAFERAHNRATAERRVLVRAAEDGRQFVHFVK